MTSNILPDPYHASASTEYSASWQAWNAFQGTTTTAWGASAGNKTGWLKIDLGFAGIATRYILKAHPSYYTLAPKDFTFKGSTNDSSWDTLDTQTGQTFNAGAPTHTYDFSNTNPYRYYLLDITDITAVSGEITLGELEIMNEP